MRGEREVAWTPGREEWKTGEDGREGERES